MTSRYLQGTDALAAKHSSIVQDDEGEDLENATELAAVEAGLPVVSAPTISTKKFLKSELPNVSDEQWTELVLALRTATQNSISASHALGLWEIKPRRLADLGLIKNLAPTNVGPDRRLVWVGEWVKPLSEDTFLGSAKLQYRALTVSLQRYAEALDTDKIPVPDDGLPEDITVSGALALLHKCGPNGLMVWCEGDVMPSTAELYARSNGIF